MQVICKFQKVVVRFDADDPQDGGFGTPDFADGMMGDWVYHRYLLSIPRRIIEVRRSSFQEAPDGHFTGLLVAAIERLRTSQETLTDLSRAAHLYRYALADDLGELTERLTDLVADLEAARGVR